MPDINMTASLKYLISLFYHKKALFAIGSPKKPLKTRGFWGENRNLKDVIRDKDKTSFIL